MNKKAGHILLAVLALILMYFWYSAVEYYEEPVEDGWTLRARINLFLAASQFLESQQFSSSTTTKINEVKLDESLTTLVLSSSDLIRDERHLNTLLDWVKEGGHIIVEASMYDNVLMDYLGVEKKETEYYSEKDDEDLDKIGKLEKTLGDIIEKTGQEEQAPEEDEEDKKKFSEILREYNERVNTELAEESETATEADSQDDCNQEQLIDPKRITNITFATIEQDLEIAFFSGTGLHYKENNASNFDILDTAESDYGVHFMQFALNHGLITLVSDIGIWQNYHIDIKDHAYLLYLLNNSWGETVFVYGSDNTSIFNLLAVHFIEALIAALVLLIAWLLYKSQRLGSVEELKPTVRRALSDHVYACAEYQWRNENYQDLLTPLRHDLFVTAARQLSAFQAQTQVERVAALATYTGIDSQFIEEALYHEAPSNSEHFYRLVKLLHKIKERL